MTRSTIISAALASLSLLASACGQKTERTATDAPVAASSAAPSGDSLTITRGGVRPVQPGPAEWFTGTVRIEPLFAATDRVQRRGGPVEEVRAGDMVWTPPGVEHWHGASPTAAMTHIAIYEHVNGNVVTWLEHVSDAEYGAAPRPRTQPTR